MENFTSTPHATLGAYIKVLTLLAKLYYVKLNWGGYYFNTNLNFILS